MNANFTFDFTDDEDRYKFETMVMAFNYRNALNDLYDLFRNKAKYNNDEEINWEKVYDEFLEFIGDRSINFFDQVLEM